MPNLNEYQTFVAIVEAKSFTGAADRLHRSVSSVSKQLSKLEGSLGVCLIDRSTQSFAVTHLGEGFYHKCKDIIEAVALAEQFVKKEWETPSGKITLSMPELMLRTPLMDLLKAFNERYPKISFEFKVSNHVEDVIESRIDFAFRLGKLNDSRLNAITLSQSRPVFCASPEYLSRFGRPDSIDTLFSKHRLILPSYLNLSEQLRHFFSSSNKLPISLDRAHTSNSETTLYQAVMKGMGVGVMLDMSILEDIEMARLSVLFPEQLLPQSQVSLVYHNGHHLSETKRVFKIFVTDNYAQFFASSLS